MGTTQNQKVDSFEAFSTTLSGVIAKLQANFASSKVIPISGTSVSVAKLISDFQSFVAANTSVEAGKSAMQESVAKRKQLKTSTKAELTALIKWAEVTYGVAAYTMLDVPAPKPRVVSPDKASIGVAKRRAAAQTKAVAKAAAKAILTPKQETVVAFDANGNAIGGPPTPAATNVAAPVVAPVVATGK